MDAPMEDSRRGAIWPTALGIAGILVGLWLTSLYSYLLFHSLAEIFSVVVACAVFALFWNMRRYLQGGYFLFVAIAYLFVALLDLLHTLAYENMGVFVGYDADLATQLWIAARYLESGSLLAAALLVRRKAGAGWVFAGFAAVTALLVWLIFVADAFPHCFSRETGLSPFKILSEYVICAMLVASGIVLVARRREFDPVVLGWLLASIAATTGAELAFTLYVSPSGPPNLVGHLLKFVSFVLIYKAMIEVGLRQPFSLVFRELKSREDALRNSEERFRTMTDFTYDWEYWLDPTGRYLYITPSCRRVTGYEADRFYQDPDLLEKITHPDDRAIVVEHHQQVQTTSEPLAMEFRIATEDGHQRWIEHCCQAVHADDGRFLGRRASNRDITDRKLAEDAVRTAQEHLVEHQRRLRERVENELKKAEDQLVRQTRLATIGRVSASIVHELRNPLTVIRYAAHYLKRIAAEDDPEVNECLEQIESQVEATNRMIDNLMEMARSKESTKEEVDVGEIASRMLSQTPATRRPRLSTHFDPDPFVVWADPVQLYQVLGNLVANAAQAMEGKGEIRIRGWREDGSDVIVVEDDGPGIPDGLRDEIFEPLVSGKPKGTGLGLAICRQIVQRHGGTIELRDNRERGAAFQIRLPRPNST